MFEEAIQSTGYLTVMELLSNSSIETSRIQDEIVSLLPIHPSSAIVSDLRQNLEANIDSIPNLCRKRQILMPTDLMLLEVLYTTLPSIEVQILVDRFLKPEVVDRVSANIPANQKARVCQVPNIPSDISPIEAVIIAVGFDGGSGYTLIPESTRSILQYYKEFYFGEVILLDPLGFSIRTRPRGWVTVNKLQLFTQHISPRIFAEVSNEK